MKNKKNVRIATPVNQKFAKAKAAKEAPANIELSKTVTDKLTHKEVINMKSLDVITRNEVTRLTKELQGAVTEFGMSGMKIGKVLKDIHILLDPRGQFVPYLNSLPGFSTATAYRYMNAYDIAISKMPKNILNTVLASGMPMLGSGDKEFGKYTDVVKKRPMPKDPSDEEAQQYVQQIQADYNNTRTKTGAKVPDPSTLQYEAFTAILKRYQKVPDKTKLYWVKQLFGYVLGNLQFAEEMSVTPKAPPTDWVATKGKEKDSEEEES